MKYLLDTNTVSEPLRPRPNTRVIRRLHQHEDEIAIPAPVWHERNRWCEHSNGLLVRAGNGTSVDSTGWWHYHAEDSDSAGYARICPLLDLLDSDGRLGGKLENWTHDALDKTVSLWSALFEQDG